LLSSGYRGCVIFDCFGAGQKVCQGTYNGHSWEDGTVDREEMLAAFTVVQQLSQWLWHLLQALSWPQARSAWTGVRQLCSTVEALRDQSGAQLLRIDLTGLGHDVDAALHTASAVVRAALLNGGYDEFAGLAAVDADADVRGMDLRDRVVPGCDLSGRRLIGVNLRSVDLDRVDVYRTDLREADVRGADFSGALYVAQYQLNSSCGDASTVIPQSLHRPAHWPLTRD
jgi:hypothetical protein